MVLAKLRKKYSGPSHLWQMDRIKEEAELRKSYGYRSKKELWKVASILRNFRAQARKLIPLTDEQASKERKELLNKLTALGLIKEGAQIDDVLGLNIKDLMERRLQTIVFKKKLSNSINQARQFITHGHIMVGDKKVTSPSMLVKVDDEPYISFSGTSALVNDMHPERVAGKEKREKKEKKSVIEEKIKEAKTKEEAKKEAKPKVEAKVEAKVEKKEDKEEIAEVGVSKEEEKEIIEAVA